MNEKKHIDRLFQEGLKDFEATPRDAVWENIEAKLNQKKKKRRVIPIWWRYAGIAALLLLLLTVGSVYFNTSEYTQPNQVVETEDASSEKINTENNNTLEGLENSSETKIATTDNTNSPKETILEAPLNKLTTSNESSIAENSTSKNKNESRLTNPNNNAIANLTEEKNSPETIQNKTKQNSAVLASSRENNTVDKEEVTIIDKEKVEKLINNTSKNNTTIAKTKEEDTDVLADKNAENNLLTIEEALEKNKDIIIEEEETQNRWSIAPNAAPVYFNTLGEGSSIDPQFNSNSKTGELNMSYGLSASYAINNKLSVRSGINKVNLGYNTNDVVVFQSANSRSALQNISGSPADATSYVSFESLNTSTIPESFITTNTSINQALGYIEVPLELQYKLSDKKLGINIIGGFSSFFLNNNEIFSEAENGNKTLLGEANNINKVSYSANFGLGLNYKMSKKIDLNLEPMFKYQINTFKNTSGNFTPFIIGVYTGFAIKF